MPLRKVGELAARLRVDSVPASTSAGSGLPTSSMSASNATLGLLLMAAVMFITVGPIRLVFAGNWQVPRVQPRVRLAIAGAIVGPARHRCLHGYGDRLPAARAPWLRCTTVPQPRGTDLDRADRVRSRGHRRSRVRSPRGFFLTHPNGHRGCHSRSHWPWPS